MEYSSRQNVDCSENILAASRVNDPLSFEAFILLKSFKLSKSGSPNIQVCNLLTVSIHNTVVQA